MTTWKVLIMAISVAVVLAGCSSAEPEPPAAMSTPSPMTQAATPLIATPTSTMAPSAVVGEETPARELATASAGEAVVRGYTEDGHAFWGAQNAPLTLIEYSDFL